MPRINTELVAEMADGTTHKVVADQRDFARWEVQPDSDDSNFHTKARFLAWSAMTRQGLTTTPFSRFNLEDCIEVHADDDEPEAEGEQGLDPGRPEASAASTSTSRAARASRSRRS
jgi:hypothetical protein